MFRLKITDIMFIWVLNLSWIHILWNSYFQPYQYKFIIKRILHPSATICMRICLLTVHFPKKISLKLFWIAGTRSILESWLAKSSGAKAQSVESAIAIGYMGISEHTDSGFSTTFEVVWGCKALSNYIYSIGLCYSRTARWYKVFLMRFSLQFDKHALTTISYSLILILEP